MAGARATTPQAPAANAGRRPPSEPGQSCGGRAGTTHPRRSADGAADRSPRAAAVRSRSGVRPLAGIEPGSRAARRPPAGRQCRWSSGGSRSVYPSSRPAGTGRGCSASSPVNWTTAESTTGTCPPSAGHWTRSCGPTGGGPAGAAHPTSPDCPEPQLPYCSCRGAGVDGDVGTVGVEREANGGDVGDGVVTPDRPM